MTDDQARHRVAGLPRFERGRPVAIDERLIPTSAWSAIDENVLRQARELAGLGPALPASTDPMPQPREMPVPAQPRRERYSARPDSTRRGLETIDRSLQRIADVIDLRLNELSRSSMRLHDLQVEPRMPVAMPVTMSVTAPANDQAGQPVAVTPPLPAAADSVAQETPAPAPAGDEPVVDLDVPDEPPASTPAPRQTSARARTGGWLLAAGFLISLGGLAGLFGWTFDDMASLWDAFAALLSPLLPSTG